MRLLPAALLLVGTLAARADPVTMFYHERPPFFVTQADGGVGGLAGSVATQVFRDAGVATVWRKLPTSRQLLVLQENKELACGVGWFRNAERERWAKFSKAFYRDHPTVLLAHADFDAQGATMAALLQRKDVRVLLKDRISYGRRLDALLAHAAAERVVTTVENTQLVQMIRAHRADFMILPAEEAEELLASGGKAGLQMLRPADLPAGDKRHIMCALRVPDDVIARLNQAIRLE